MTTTTTTEPLTTGPTEEISYSLEDADPQEDNLTHVVFKGDDLKGFVLGTPVRALCGRVWVPSKTPDPKNVCKPCLKVLESFSSLGQ